MIVFNKLFKIANEKYFLFAVALCKALVYPCIYLNIKLEHIRWEKLIDLYENIIKHDNCKELLNKNPTTIKQMSNLSSRITDLMFDEFIGFTAHPQNFTGKIQNSFMKLAYSLQYILNLTLLHIVLSN